MARLVPRQIRMTIKAPDRLVPSLVVILLILLLSLTYQYEDSYWAENIWIGVASFVTGVVLAIYVFTSFCKLSEKSLTKGDEFYRRYFAELDGKPEAWRIILDTSHQGNVTLLFGAIDIRHKNAVALKLNLEACLSSEGEQ
jgi:hypothetical protein